MILAGEYRKIFIPPDLVLPSSGPLTAQLHSQHSEAKRFLIQSAYLDFGPAQLKVGNMYEHALLECPYDPMLSIRYYIRAGQHGEVQADLALSKWFMIGAGEKGEKDYVERDPQLARVFACKAAECGLAPGCLAYAYCLS